MTPDDLATARRERARRMPLLIALLFVLGVASWGLARAQPPCAPVGCTYVPLIRAYVQPTATPVPVTLLTNGDFEQGATFWQPQAAANTVIITDPPAPVTPHGGTHVARLTATRLNDAGA